MQLIPLNDLRNIFGSGKHEAQAIISDIESQAYRNMLAKFFSTYLVLLLTKPPKSLEELQFDPELARKMHKGTTLTPVFYSIISFTA